MERRLKNQRLQEEESMKGKGEKRRRKGKSGGLEKSTKKFEPSRRKKKKKMANQRSLIPRISKFQILDFRSVVGRWLVLLSLQYWEGFIHMS